MSSISLLPGQSVLATVNMFDRMGRPTNDIGAYGVPALAVDRPDVITVVPVDALNWNLVVPTPPVEGMAMVTATLTDPNGTAPELTASGDVTVTVPIGPVTSITLTFGQPTGKRF